MSSNDNKRKLATITNVFYGLEDHGILTCSITLSDMGYTQSFGGIFLNEKSGPDFCSSLCNLFRVDDVKELIDKKCYALYNFDEWNETIEGLEALNGDRFTLTKFSRKYNPETKSRLERKQEDLEREIIRAQEKIDKAKEELKSFKDKYTDWEV